MRNATVDRQTTETSIHVSVGLDGSGRYSVSTGVGFLDHMIEQLSRHSLIDIDLAVKGDLHIDFHHTAEDSGIVLGQAVAKALGTGFADGVVWTGIEVVRDVHGAPSLVLHGEAARVARRLGITGWRVSLSHTKEMAGASVVALG